MSSYIPSVQFNNANDIKLLEYLVSHIIHTSRVAKQKNRSLFDKTAPNLIQYVFALFVLFHISTVYQSYHT